MNLSTFLKSIGESPTSWGVKHNLPGPRLHDHVKNEEGSASHRRLGPKLAVAVVIASEGQVSLNELLPDLAPKMKEALKLEAGYLG